VLVELDLDGSGGAMCQPASASSTTCAGQIARHGAVDLTVRTAGDLHVDAHHTVEDTALALGAALGEALGDKAGVRRFGSVHVPLDEVLVQAAVDLSGRPYVVHEEPAGLAPFVGGTGPLFPTSLTRHVWESLGHAARLTLHGGAVAARPGVAPDAPRGGGAVQGVRPRASDAVAVDPRATGVPSTKGVL
jgi:imidazoleglycerol-phosphate dehydratase